MADNLDVIKRKVKHNLDLFSLLGAENLESMAMSEFTQWADYLEALYGMGEDTGRSRMKYWVEQFIAQKKGVSDGTIHDSALVAFSYSKE